jgi:hypothetical protein
MVRSCGEENVRVEIETAILKHKCDCMGQDEEVGEENLTEEERIENARVAQLAEEMSAQTRMVFNSEDGVWDARGLRVTDYKHNSRVIFPKAQTGEKENDLEVLRAELLHHHREWVKANCNCRGEQKANLSKDEQLGLKRLRKRVADGSIVVLPTDKSGRFALMSMNTYIKAGMVHIKDDDEVGIEERRANQRVVNGAVSMLLKIFRVGKNCRHEGRWRESMISNSLEACPLWLLFKDHKSWVSSKGVPPPTRPVMGGNGGMNTHLSEILSWLLEPLANSMMGKSSEVISDEDLKNKMDNLNQKNSDWKPEEQITEPMGDSTEMSEKLGEAPGLCGCEECVHPDDINSQGTEEGGCVHAQTGSESNNLDKTYQKNNNAPVQSIYGGHPDGEKRTLSQITIPEGWKNQNPDEGNVMCGPDGQIILSKDETVGEEGVNAQTGTDCNIVIQSNET